MAHEQYVATKARLYIEELLLKNDDKQRWLVFHLLLSTKEGQVLRTTDGDIRVLNIDWKPLIESNVLREGPDNLLRVHDSVLARFEELNAAPQKAMFFIPKEEEQGHGRELDKAGEDAVFEVARTGVSIEEIMTIKGLTRDVVRGAIQRAGERYVHRFRGKPVQ